MRFLLSSSFCFLVVAALFLSPDLLHGQVTYTVTGFANLGFEGDPDSAPEVSLGEMYVAQFEIDLSVPDMDSDPTRGLYTGAIVSGSIEFSGGYTSQIDFAGGDIVIQQDIGGGGVFFDSPDGSGTILVGDLGNAFDSDTLLTDIGAEIVGSPLSLFVLMEPTGFVAGFSEEDDVGFGTPVTGRMRLSVSETVSTTPLLLGDVNLDGEVTFGDIDPFINILTENSFQEEADFDENGAVNFFDIPGFIEALSAG